MIVDNRPGADEMLGDEIIAKASPDGYTLGVSEIVASANSVDTESLGAAPD